MGVDIPENVFMAPVFKDPSTVQRVSRDARNFFRLVTGRDELPSAIEEAYEDYKRKYDEYVKRVQDYNSNKVDGSKSNTALDQESRRAANEAANNLMEDLIGSVVSDFTPNAIKELDSFVSELNKIMIAAFKANNFNMANSVANLVIEISSARNDFFEYTDAIEQNNNAIIAAKGEIDGYNRKIEAQKAALDGLKDRLKEINDDISYLSKPEFVGQYGTQKLIDDLTRYEKQQKLAALGITDVYGFIQTALNSTESEYGNLLKSIKAVNEETKTGEDSYKAWQETVMEFIKDAVSSGNLLAQNVSNAVNKYSTLLLSTSKFGEEQQSQEDYINALRDAYDIYYGGMQSDVEDAVHAHEMEGKTIFSTSAEVVQALKSQWEEQDKVTNAIDGTQLAIDALQESIDLAKDSIAGYSSTIDILNSKLEEMIRLQKEAALSTFSGFSGFNGASSGDLKSAALSGFFSSGSSSTSINVNVSATSSSGKDIAQQVANEVKKHVTT